MNKTKKSKTIRKSENGQAIVLMMLFITAMLAIAGLAVDGGRAYYSQRTAQNAADNAALAAAWAACSGGNVNNIAFASALSNEYDNDGSTNTVTVNRPPSSGPNVGDNEYIEVIINSVEEAGFSQLVFSGTLESTVRAVGRCSLASGPVGSGYALIALDPNLDRAFHGHGKSNTIVDGGGIFINSDDDDRALWAHQDSHLTVLDGSDVVGAYQIADNGTITIIPTTGAIPMSDPLAALPPPTNPGGTCNNYSISGTDIETIDPGLYCKIQVTGNAELTMNSGIYYIDSGDFKVEGNAILNGDEVMIYLNDGKFELKGTGGVDLTPPSTGLYAGMVLFMDQANDDDVKIEAKGPVSIAGTIYAAASHLALKADVDTMVLDAQIIVNDIRTDGDGDIEINYLAENVYGGGANISIVELAE